MRPRFESVIFDLDGTLADTEPLVLGCMLETINAAGFAVDQAMLMKYIGPPLPVMLFNMLGLDAEAAHPIYMAYLDRYEREYMPRTKPLPGAETLLDALGCGGGSTGGGHEQARGRGAQDGRVAGLDRAVCDDHRRGYGAASEAARGADRACVGAAWIDGGAVGDRW